MLDIHPAHHAASTWRDFFIHIATIVVGLLIAVGLEQMVEAIHHHHQRAELLDQMRDEARHNLPFESDSISRLLIQMQYLNELRSALLDSVASGDSVVVHGIVPRGGSVLHVSPSRSVWAAAKSGGVASILPSYQAQLYARRDFNADWEEQSESAMYEKMRDLKGQFDRVSFRYADPAAMRITVQQRGDVVFALDHLIMKMEELTIRLGIERGADEAVATGETSLDALYPYQARNVEALHLGSGATGNFFGTASGFEYKADQPGDSKH